MSNVAPSAPRLSRRASVIAAAVALAALMAGCSAAAESYEPEYDGGEDFGADTRYGAPDAEYAGEDTLFAADGSSTANEAPASDRALIITGEMYITVENPILAADRAEGIVQAAGGRVDARNETAPEGSYGGEAWLTLRIPAPKLDAVVDDLRELGTVDRFGTDSYDVTVQVTDLEAKISTLRASTARIEGLLADAKSISDIITLERELDSRQSELESLEAQQRGLTDQVSMSTIQLSLTTEPVVIVQTDDSPDSFWDGVVAGWDALYAFVAAALIVLGVMLPWLAVIGVIVFAIIATFRSRRSRHDAHDQAVAQAPVMAAPRPPSPPRNRQRPAAAVPVTRRMVGTGGPERARDD